MNNKPILTIASISLLLLTIYAALSGSETILPSALVLLLLCVIGLSSPTEGPKDSTLGKAAQSAIVSFTIFVAVLSLLVSLFLPGIAVAYGMTELFDGDFVRVSINDAHELAYSTCLLLILNILFLARHRRKRNAPLHTGDMRASARSLE